MENNHYQPPKSGFGKPPRNQEPGSLIKAVLLGIATDVGGTLVLGIVLGIAYGVVLASQGQSAEQIQQTMEHIDPWSPMGLLSSLSGLSMSMLGGYVCARTANVNSYTAIGILSAISVAVGSIMGVGAYEWEALLMLNLLGLAAIFLGGWWYIRKLAPQA
jgi:hypothetical protein